MKNNFVKQNCIRAITDFLTTDPLCNRKSLLNGAFLLYSTRHKTSLLQKPAVRSYLGTVLNELVASGDVSAENGRYELKKEALIIVEERLVFDRIFSLLKKQSLSKEMLFRSLQKYFGTTETPSKKDDNILRSTAGSILARGVENGTIDLIGGKYSLSSPSHAYNNAPLQESDFKPLFLSRLHQKGGPFFERFMANLLEKYYLLTGRDVIYCEVSGGSADGGIDVIIDTEDELGFAEHILLQTKCRRSAHVTEKEVREFFGAMNAQNGTRGIYATTSFFHPAAQTFLDSLDNCVGIDGDKLFALVKKTAYGIHKTQRGLSFDQTVFGE